MSGAVMVERFLVDYGTDAGALVQGAAEFLGGAFTAKIFVTLEEAEGYASSVSGMCVWSVDVDLAWLMVQSMSTPEALPR